MVAVPVVPPIVPLPLVPTLITAELLELNEVDAVLSVPFSDAVKLIADPVGVVERLIVVPRLEFIVSTVD